MKNGTGNIQFKAGVVHGIKMAASVAGEYDASCSHEYSLEDCVLAKLNVIGNRKLRKNKRFNFKSVLRAMNRMGGEYAV